MPKTLPALQIVQDEIEKLRELRRRLCCYVNSDNFCDCKTLTGLPLYTSGQIEPKPRSGERTGCCEVRAAIAMLTLVEKSCTSIETKSEEKAKEPRGTYGNCADCDCPFYDTSAQYDWPIQDRKNGKTLRGRVQGLEFVCCTCHEKRVKKGVAQ